MNSNLIEYPILPVKNTIAFPGLSLPLVVGRKKSILSIQSAEKRGGMILVITQKNNQTIRDPKISDLYDVGVLSKIEHLLGDSKTGIQISIRGKQRFRIDSFFEKEGCLFGSGNEVPDIYSEKDTKTKGIFLSLKQSLIENLKLLAHTEDFVKAIAGEINEPIQLTHLCSLYLNIPIEKNQKLLEEPNVLKRMETLLDLIKEQREILLVQKDIQEKMTSRMSQDQRKVYLRAQLNAIREELGESEDPEAVDFNERIKKSIMPPEAKKVAKNELKRLQALPSSSAEYHVIRNYLDWIIEMPWKSASNKEIDLKQARKVLDQSHFGLEKVKERILQYIAVLKVKRMIKGPILCFLGPPGVGKTSIGQSIADALDRIFIRASLGGIRDESDIRGHRRTYVGAMPGRIIQGIKRSGTNNPVFMLDEIDKLAFSFQGDPASALLEVLDPEQNSKFQDHYLDIDYDLSNVFFIVTANVLEAIPPALRDRLEVIEIPSYTIDEKIEIASRYIVPKALEARGLTLEECAFNSEIIESIIIKYTREPGVRELKRKIDSICRALIEKKVEKEEIRVSLNNNTLREILGPQRIYQEIAEKPLPAGVVTGLAWTPSGGEILFIEAAQMPGSGRTQITGQLGDVMRESVEIALSLVRSHASNFCLDHDFSKIDLHIHVPAGAVPKDGPSAGVAILVGLGSLFCNRPVDHHLAMTGEITLGGRVLPVGGVREKVLAAHRAGITRIILPKMNENDLYEIKSEVKNAIEFIFAETSEEVLKVALSIKFNRSSKNVSALSLRNNSELLLPDI